MSEIFTIPANSEINIDIPARYIYIENVSVNNATFDIKAHTESGLYINEEMSKGAKLTALPEVVTNWAFKNDNAFDLTVTIKAGLVYYNKNELIGDVTAAVVHQNLSANATQFWAGVKQYHATELSYALLLNPVGSGIDATVKRIAVSQPAGLARLATFTSAALTGTNTKTILGINKHVNNIVLGPKGKCAAVAYHGFHGSTDIAELYLATDSEPTVFDFGESPIYLAEGYAVGLYSTSVGATTAATFEWSEA